MSSIEVEIRFLQIKCGPFDSLRKRSSVLVYITFHVQTRSAVKSGLGKPFCPLSRRFVVFFAIGEILCGYGRDQRVFWIAVIHKRTDR